MPGVSSVVSCWQTRNPGLRSEDGKYALVLGSTRSDHAVVVLPALLAVLGRRVNSGRLPWARNREPSPAAPCWGRLAGQAIRRPAVIAIPVLAALNVVTGGPLDCAALTGYAIRLSDLAGVARVETSTATFVHGKAVPDSANPALARPTAQRLSVVSTADPRSNAAKDLVRTVRDLRGPAGAGVYVGDQTAELIGTTHAIGTRLPLAGLLVVLSRIKELHDQGRDNLV